MDAWTDYSFDVRGFILVRGALSAAQLAEARAALASSGGGGWGGGGGGGGGGGEADARDDLRWLAEHPATASAVELCSGNGSGNGQGTACLVVPPYLLATHQQLNSSRGGVRRERSDGYFTKHGTRAVQRVRCVFAIEDSLGDAIVIIPNSHRAELEAPPAVLAGSDDLRSLGESLHWRPELHAGDLLLYSPALLHRMDGRGGGLIGCEFAAHVAAIEVQRADAATEDLEGDLSPELRAILNYGDDALHTVLSDGVQTWLGDREDARQDHPRVLVPPPAHPVGLFADPAEAFAWDLNGYIILRDVMTPELMAAANTAIDSQRDDAARDHARAQQEGIPTDGKVHTAFALGVDGMPNSHDGIVLDDH